MSAVTDLITSAAGSAGVPASLALAVAHTESGFNQAAVSPKGAIGIFQLMPATAAGLGVNPNDAAQNIAGGVTYLSQMLARYHGNTAQALAAYNAGPGRVDAAISSAGADWLSALPTETQNYVAGILGPSYAPPAQATNSALPTDSALTASLDAASIAASVDPTSTSNGTSPAPDPTTVLLVAGGALLLLLVLD